MNDPGSTTSQNDGKEPSRTLGIHGALKDHADKQGDIGAKVALNNGDIAGVSSGFY